MTTTKTAREVARRIHQNVKDVDAGRITWDEFSARQRAAWDSVIRGDLAVIGSACSRRLAAVNRALQYMQ